MGLADWFASFCSKLQVQDGGTISSRCRAISTRGESLREPVLAWLKAHGPANTKAIARALTARIPPVRAALYQLESERHVHTTGQKRSQRWNLGPKVPGQAASVGLSSTQKPAKSAPQAKKPVADTKQDVEAGLATAIRDQAMRSAKMFGHTLGAFKSSSPSAGSQFIARCTGCDTYVTVAKDSKISGPGTRHECLAVASR